MAAHQAPPSLGFSRQEHWSRLPFPSPNFVSTLQSITVKSQLDFSPSDLITKLTLAMTCLFDLVLVGLDPRVNTSVWLSSVFFMDHPGQQALMVAQWSSSLLLGVLFQGCWAAFRGRCRCLSAPLPSLSAPSL